MAGCSSEGGSSSIYIEPTERNLKWLKDAWVGRLSNPTMFDKAEDELRWDYGLDISTTYLGDDMILIIGLNEEKAEQLLKELNQRTPPLLYSLQKWSPTLRPGYRLAWVQCWGIPAIIWDDVAIKKILGLLGDVLEFDEEVEERRRMDRARVLLKTPWKPFIHHTVNMHVGSEVYEVTISEERGPNAELWKKMRRSGMTSSDEILSDYSFMESPKLEMIRGTKRSSQTPWFSAGRRQLHTTTEPKVEHLPGRTRAAMATKTKGLKLIGRARAHLPTGTTGIHRLYPAVPVN